MGNDPAMSSTRIIGRRHAAPILAAIAAIAGCSAPSGEASERPAPSPRADAAPADPPPRIRAWMDRLTVDHAYDPETGFIVARETIGLPPALAGAPPLDEVVRTAGDRTVIAFATADRCAPCQQYKKDALNDPRVIARLARPGLTAAHVEVDREPELAETYLGGPAIPMTYALRDGVVIAELRGPR